MSSDSTLPPDADFGGFRILEQIGRGSMGTVYKVVHIETGEVRALKVRLLARDHERDLRRVEREAEAGQQVASPYIAKTFETGVDEKSGTAWIIMDYVQGVSLNDLVEERGALPRSLVYNIASQIFDALTAAHRVGIVHRDLSPSNIRVKLDSDDTPVTKVLDFGIAKSTRSATGAWTKPGLGTPLWVAPEQHLSGYAPAPSDDVWALGLLLFFMLTGKHYWKHAQPGATSLGDLSMEILRYPVVGAAERAEELGVATLLPTHFGTWFERCVARDSETRYGDAGEAFSGLISVFADEAPAVVKSRPRRSTPPISDTDPRRQRRSQRPPENSSSASLQATPAPETPAPRELDAPQERPGVVLPSGRVMLLLFFTLLAAGYVIYAVVHAALL